MPAARNRITCRVPKPSTLVRHCPVTVTFMGCGLRFSTREEFGKSSLCFPNSRSVRRQQVAVGTATDERKQNNLPCAKAVHSRETLPGDRNIYGVRSSFFHPRRIREVQSMLPEFAFRPAAASGCRHCRLIKENRITCRAPKPSTLVRHCPVTVTFMGCGLRFSAREEFGKSSLCFPNSRSVRRQQVAVGTATDKRKQNNLPCAKAVHSRETLPGDRNIYGVRPSFFHPRRIREVQSMLPEFAFRPAAASGCRHCRLTKEN